ncbi:MAG: hypothetical protein KPI85_05970 [cyanobacterium endosymbiont of Epithemia adnata isolate EadnSB Bon19]
MSLPSQRVDCFDKNIVEIIVGISLFRITFAFKAGNQRLRDVINKG